MDRADSEGLADELGRLDYLRGFSAVVPRDPSRGPPVRLRCASVRVVRLAATGPSDGDDKAPPAAIDPSGCPALELVVVSGPSSLDVVGVPPVAVLVRECAGL